MRDWPRLPAALDELLRAAERGRRLREGLHAVIVGPPNAGKSSLLNALAGRDRAIVTDIAGTTRDLLHEVVRIDGVELTLVDTAGLREGGDAIEREGMRRARGELERADLAIVVLDARDPEGGAAARGRCASPACPRACGCITRWTCCRPQPAAAPEVVHVSAHTGQGLEALHRHLRELAGGDAAGGEGEFTARARHVDALVHAQGSSRPPACTSTTKRSTWPPKTLRLAHDQLGEITGKVRADDLLGHIFASFCIGK